MENLLIRRLEARDADDISRIQEAITKQPVAIDYRTVVEAEARKEDRVSFVAELDGKVVGYMITYIIYGGFGLEKSAWVGLFGVDPRYMGRGIGKMLAREVFDVFRKIDVRNVFTSVKWDSTDLLSFFKSLGFRRCDFINLEKILD
ncbi:MAG: GNAT family N-acetyltransferase [Deltaproteobacteria bacterium]|nr:MAG: GNAT family N-acetyltransferase [Deltaproteobacteria bacterium]